MLLLRSEWSQLARGLALVDEDSAVDGTEVTLLWGEPEDQPVKPAVGPHTPTPIRAVVSTTPLT